MVLEGLEPFLTKKFGDLICLAAHGDLKNGITFYEWVRNILNIHYPPHQYSLDYMKMLKLWCFEGIIDENPWF